MNFRKVSVIGFLLFACFAKAELFEMTTEQGGALLRLRALPSAKINQEAPLLLKLMSEHKARLVSKNTNEVLWSLEGSQSPLKGHLLFYLCTKKSCHKFEKDLGEVIDNTTPKP